MTKTSKVRRSARRPQRWAAALRRLADLVERGQALCSDDDDDGTDEGYYWLGIHRDIVKKAKVPITRHRAE